MSQPNYRLRPNKYVDRQLFVNCLEKISRIIKISSHRYIGFGSYFFEDFKIIHDRLNISSMISLESNSEIYERARYNKPYKCVKIIKQSSTDYISGGEWGAKRSIIWLDYSNPRELAEQFSDIAALSNILDAKDIFKITLNATPSTLGLPKNEKEMSILEYRLAELKERIGPYIPLDVMPSDLSTENYPILLLRCIKKLIEGCFVENEYNPLFVLPLFTTVYRDGHTMVTFTGIVLNNHNIEKRIIRSYKDTQFVNFEWDKPARIQIPDLTVKEMLEINKLLPSKNAQKQLMKKFGFVFSEGSQEVDSYLAFYKYYPNFHSVNF